MKKLLLILTFSTIYFAADAQIKVLNNNRVIVGSPIATWTNFDFDVFGETYIRCLPATSGLHFENYHNSVGGGPFDEPIIKGQFGNAAWLGNASAPFWRVYSNQVHSYNFITISSDQRLKSNIQPLESALSKIKLMNPVRYDFNTPVNEELPETKKVVIRELGKNQIGLIAQELEEIYPEAVNFDEESDLYSVKYGMLIPVLIKAIQEQQQRIEALEQQLNQVETK